MDVGALTPPLWGFEEREKLMVFYERASGSRMHAAYFRIGGVHQDLPPKLIDDIDAWCDPFLKVVDDLETLLTGNRIFKQRNVDIGVVIAEAGLGVGLLRRDGARLGRRLGSAQVAALRMLRRDGFRHSDRQERRLLRPLLHPHGRDAPVGAHHEAVHRQAARAGRAGAGRRRRQQDRAAAPWRDEALDGSADPPLQALHRRRPRAGRRGLCRGRGAEGRVRRLSGRRRHQQALQVQDPRAGLCPSAGDGFHLPAAICWPTSRPSSARSTSCSERSIGDGAGAHPV